MQLGLRRGRCALQQALHEVDAPARTIEFIAQQSVGRATSVTEAAMDALANNTRGLLGGSLSLQLGREVQMHGPKAPDRGGRGSAHPPGRTRLSADDEWPTVRGPKA